MEIGGKEYELKFGLAFINCLDKQFSAQTKGMDFGLGLTPIVAKLEICNPQAVFDVIRAGTITEKQKPSNEDIEKYVESADIERECNDFLSRLESSPLIAPMFRKLKEIEL